MVITLEHVVTPDVWLPETVYTVVVVGLGLILGPFCDVLQVYDDAPLTVTVNGLFKQMVFDAAVKVGKFTTDTCDIAVLVHVFTSVPVTV